MEIPLFDDGDVVRQPKDKVRIEALDITPYPDRFRIHIHLRVTPFEARPNLVLVAHDDHDRIVSELNVIETMHHDMEFTMHLRNVEEPAGVYTLTVDLFYESKNPPQDRIVETFEVPEATPEEGE